MKIYSSLSQTIEPFQPRDKTVTIYVCGITPYDTTHMGHAFTYTINDVLIRYLEFLGYSVKYAQNVTDIDDDILRKAREMGEDWRTLGNYWTAFFINDLISLNIRPPEYYPRATEFISEMIHIIESLLAQGLAYAREGNVYFDTDAWPEFGKLSHLPRQEMLPIANQRGNRPDDPHKRNPLDFVLWQAQAAGEPAWHSPWGLGRPGWHIECSAMASNLLGEMIDFHSGGGDLLFPHHECEIAQLEPVTGRQPFVRYWLHVAMVYHQGEKMSKSLGNLIMCRDLLKEVTPDALRLYLVNHHYRQSWNYDRQELNQAGLWGDKLRQAVTVESGRGERLDPLPWIARFQEAMNDDLNTPLAVDVLKRFGDAVIASAAADGEVQDAQKQVRRLSAIFGLRLDLPGVEERVVDGWTEHLKRFSE
jgi:L-cysteine:1D-myo-inositol 2-amino-2-deoxy-alpha-D-glucopyranoside ligase